MAGHPTVGTAFALAETGFLAPGSEATVFELRVGPTRVALDWDGPKLAAATMQQRAPEFGVDRFDRTLLAKALGVTEEDIDGVLPVLPGSAGVEFLYVPLLTRDAVDRSWLDVGATDALFAHAASDHLAAYVFTLEPGDDGATAYGRMFGTVLGMTEDPATGGAAGPLAAYLVKQGRIATAQEVIIRQGVKMGRPGTIRAMVEAEGTVTVGGPAVVVGDGSLRI
jgi:trans-2,3-dihydro-3-hydroxyanthranilate isomerase